MVRWSAGAKVRPSAGSANASGGSSTCSDGADTTAADCGPTGNRAFDEYREEALRRLEEEANEFRTFLERLRMAKDRQEFDEYMGERRNRPSDPTRAPDPKPQA